jgi:hypothetical protein
MNAVEKAKLALLKAETEAKLETQKRCLDELNEKYKGRCIANNLFSAGSKTSSKHAVYYEKFYLKDEDLYVKEWVLSLTYASPVTYKRARRNVNYHTYIHDRPLGFADQRAIDTLVNYYGYLKLNYDLSVEKFMDLWVAADEARLVIENIFASRDLLLTETYSAEYNPDRTYTDCVKDLGIDMVDMTKYPDLYDCIKYYKLPLFQDGMYMYKPEMKRLLGFILKDLNKDLNRYARTYSSRIYEATQRQIDIIQKFINNTK